MSWDWTLSMSAETDYVGEAHIPVINIARRGGDGKVE